MEVIPETLYHGNETMTELRTLQVTDIEDDYEKYPVVTDYIAKKKGTSESIDALFVAGDWIQAKTGRGDKTADRAVKELQHSAASGDLHNVSKELNAFGAKHSDKIKDGALNIDQLEKEEDKKVFLELIAKKWAKEGEVILKTVKDSYQRHAAEVDKIDIPIFGVLGNNDLTVAYDFLGKKVTFLEKEKQAKIVGKSGIEFLVKGDLNTWETPGLYSEFSPALRKHFIPYLSGYSLSQLNTKVKELENSKDGEKINYTPEMQAELEYSIGLREEVTEFAAAERQRLGSKNEVDIYLTHKLPSCKKARSDVKGTLSDITQEYAANAKAVYGGHFDDGQIGYKTIENLLRQECGETTIIDGVEVPVFYLDDKEPWELNPGTDHFFVTEYDANKQIEQVVIHKFYYEEAA